MLRYCPVTAFLHNCRVKLYIRNIAGSECMSTKGVKVDNVAQLARETEERRPSLVNKRADRVRSVLVENIYL